MKKQITKRLNDGDKKAKLAIANLCLAWFSSLKGAPYKA